MMSSTDSRAKDFKAFVASMTFCRPWFMRSWVKSGGEMKLSIRNRRVFHISKEWMSKAGVRIIMEAMLQNIFM